MQLRNAVPEDREILYKWATEPSTRMFSLNKSEILWEEHCSWFHKKLTDETCVFLMGIVDQEPIGTVRFDSDYVQQESIISITIAPEMRGKGYASQLIKTGTKDSRVLKPVIAYIQKENIASIKSFEKCGFKLKGSSVINNVALDKYEYQ